MAHEPNMTPYLNTLERFSTGGAFWRNADTLRVGNMINDIGTLKTERDDALAEQKRLQSSLDSASEELEFARTAVTNTRVALEQANVTITDLQKEREAMLERVQTAENTTIERDSAIATLTDERDALQDQLANTPDTTALQEKLARTQTILGHYWNVVDRFRGMSQAALNNWPKDSTQ